MLMDTPFHHFCNREFVAELRQLRDRNVLLLLLDGSAAFGRLGRIEDCVLEVLPAVGIIGVNAVRFRTPNLSLPGGGDILLNEMLLDVCSVAAIVEGPFVFPPLSETGKPPVSPKYTPSYPKTVKSVVRQQNELICELEEFEGQNVGVMCVGGWTIGGQLGEVCDCVAVFGPGTTSAPPLITLGAVNVFGPALMCGLQPMVGTFRCLSNLRALTGVLIP